MRCRPNIARFTGWALWGPHPDDLTLHYVREGERAGLCGRKLGGWMCFHHLPQNPQHRENARAVYCEACWSALGLAPRNQGGAR